MMITFKRPDGKDCSGFYADPPGGNKAPALVVIQEWWGLNENIQHWTDRLAADGYAALAVDLYDGTVATTRDEALETMKAVEDERALGILKAAFGFLKEDPRGRASKRAANLIATMAGM